MSRIAVTAAPVEGLCDVFPGGEQRFLEPLEISVLPEARPVRTSERLRELNIERVKQLVPVPMPALRLAFGRAGLSLFRQARGLDASPVRTPSRAPRVTVEETLTEESNEDTVLLLALRELAEDAGHRLRSMQTDTGRMEVEIQYTDGVQARRSARIRPAAHRDLALFLAARELLEQAAQRRVRLRRITLHCLDLQVRSGQGELFPAEEILPPAERRREALQQALDGIRRRFGKEAVRNGSAPVGGPASRNIRAGR